LADAPLVGAHLSVPAYFSSSTFRIPLPPQAVRLYMADANVGTGWGVPPDDPSSARSRINSNTSDTPSSASRGSGKGHIGVRRSRGGNRGSGGLTGVVSAGSGRQSGVQRQQQQEQQHQQQQQGSSGAGYRREQAVPASCSRGVEGGRNVPQTPGQMTSWDFVSDDVRFRHHHVGHHQAAGGRQPPPWGLCDDATIEGINRDRTDLTAILGSLQGQVCALSVDQHGCRLVQRVLAAVDDRGKETIANELKGHVKEVLESPHANHVLQACIQDMRPPRMRFVIVELNHWGRPPALARHRYGCRILERLIEHFDPYELEYIVAEILKESFELIKHVYGNFVMQHILEHGLREQRQQIINALLLDLNGAALDQHACSVLDKALSYGNLDDQRKLARALLSEPGLLGSEPGLLAAMAGSRGGFAATQRLFQVVEGSDLAEARHQLGLAAADLQKTKHGKALIAAVGAPELNTSGGYLGGASEGAAGGASPTGTPKRLLVPQR